MRLLEKSRGGGGKLRVDGEVNGCGWGGLMDEVF